MLSNRFSSQRGGASRSGLRGALGAGADAGAVPTEPQYDYSPAGEATIAAGETATLEYRGQSGSAFAFDRILCGGDLDLITATARTNQGRSVLFNDVHLSALRDLTRFRRLKGLLFIPTSDKLTLDLKNRSGEEATANVQLAGYADQETIEAQVACLASSYGRAFNGRAPQPELLTAYAELPAGAEGVRLQMSRSFPVEFRRFFVAASRPESVRVELKVYQDTVKERVYASQITDEYLWHEAARPFRLETATPMTVLVSNASADPVQVSVLVEAYRLD